MQTKPTTITLINWTSDVVETIYYIWQHSRTDGPVPPVKHIKARIQNERNERMDELAGGENNFMALGPAEKNRLAEQVSASPGPFESEVRKVFEDCVMMKVPIAEQLNFIWAIDNMPIALREQWVRHRVGQKYGGGDVAFESIPNIADSSWWSQTFRAKNLGSFASNGDYLIPEWVSKNSDKTVVCPDGSVRPMGFAWNWAHGEIQNWYNSFVQAGMPLEDARNVLPLGVQHRMTWTCNLASLMHILSKRGCWIAQMGMWEPVIFGIVNELATKVDPFFRRLVDPPCFGKDGKFDRCPYSKENKEYIAGRDPHHPCPLWLHHHCTQAYDEAYQMEMKGEIPSWKASAIGVGPVVDPQGKAWFPQYGHVTRGTVADEIADFSERKDKYAELWGRDPVTGERKRLS